MLMKNHQSMVNLKRIIFKKKFYLLYSKNLNNNKCFVSLYSTGEIEYPERRRLRIYEKVPQYPPTMRPFKMQKRLRYMRGPEPVHNFLLHKQYGVIVCIFFFFTIF